MHKVKSKKQNLVIWFLVLNFILLQYACRQIKNKDEMVIVDRNVEIPLKPCIEINKKILGNSVDVNAFCRCLIPKIYTDTKGDPAKVKLLEDGNWNELSAQNKNTISQYYEECIAKSATTDSTAKLTITPEMAVGMKKEIKNQLKGTEVEKANDVDKYCDCIINGLQTDFSAKELMQTNFNETEKYQKMVKRCLSSTKKK